MIWNWQENANGAITELNVKLGLAQSLVNGLQATYPSSGAIPNYQNFTGTEAATLTYYNGMGGGQIRFIRLNGIQKTAKDLLDESIRRLDIPSQSTRYGPNRIRSRCQNSHRRRINK
jgi:hypothetical protein